MKIVVASKNPVKQGAVEKAFGAAFPDATLDVIAAECSSGVGHQPASDNETRVGASNRARGAHQAVPDADYWVGIEGGIEPIADTLQAFAWIVIRGPHGKYGRARTVSLPLPEAIRLRIKAGEELGDANDAVFNTSNSKQAGGAFGLLTDGRYTRESVYVEAVTMALLPLVNPIYD